MMSETENQDPTALEQTEDEAAKAMPPPPKPKEAEKVEEAKLRAKYPQLKGGPGSSLLQKRLSKGQKYFDSGDYNMAKAGKKSIPTGPKLLLAGGTGQEHPTPETIHARKASLVPAHANLS